MKPSLSIIAVYTVLLISCGPGSGQPEQASAPGASPADPSSPVSMAGGWSGTAMDSQGAVVVTWALDQTDTSVSGTVSTRAVDPTDGSCNSCHRNKTGTFSGTMIGNTLTLTMFFPSGTSTDPTPICTATLSGTGSSVSPGAFNAVYSGSDSCEGPFMNGTLTMTHQP
jgi:hypothetical protein